MTLLNVIVLTLTVVLTVQSLISLWLMLYTWEDKESIEASRPPTDYLPPQLSFTVLLPARDEKDVIYETINKVWAADYPHDLLEIFVVCHDSDTETIEEAQRCIDDIGSPNIRVLTFDTPPINKPHGLNVGLLNSTKDILTVFDAEDDIAPEVFNIVNTIMITENPGVIQGGVQLMNFKDTWFSLHNCLEYFFWFKSRLHFHAKVGMIPLGGNTVFFKRELLQEVGGWDETCLTEDADIGLRLSNLGEKIRVFYDARYTTREETPPTIKAFVKQRTRWHQGFLQVLKRDAWKKLATPGQRWLAFFTLSYPYFQAMMLFLVPFSLTIGLTIKTNMIIAMLSFVPLYIFFLQLIVTIIGAYSFARDYNMKMPASTSILLAVTSLPYQMMQGVSAFRALNREMGGQNDWEKTAHVGAHR